MGTECANCGHPGATKRCGRCKTTYYCQKECQRSDYKAHKRVCAQLATGVRRAPAGDDPSAPRA